MYSDVENLRNNIQSVSSCADWGLNASFMWCLSIWWCINQNLQQNWLSANSLFDGALKETSDSFMWCLSIWWCIIQNSQQNWLSANSLFDGALKETSVSTKQIKKNENYNEILENPSSSTSRPCRRPIAAAAPPWIGLTLLVADGNLPNGRKDRIHHEDEEVEWITDEAPCQSEDPHTQEKSSKITLHPQISECRPREGVEAR
jgi:hypothetical protein